MSRGWMPKRWSLRGKLLWVGIKDLRWIMPDGVGRDGSASAALNLDKRGPGPSALKLGYVNFARYRFSQSKIGDLFDLNRQTG